MSIIAAGSWGPGRPELEASPDRVLGLTPGEQQVWAALQNDLRHPARPSRSARRGNADSNARVGRNTLPRGRTVASAGEQIFHDSASVTIYQSFVGPSLH